MADLNRQRAEGNHLIAVTLVPGQQRAAVTVRQPAGGGRSPEFVDLAPFLNAGLSDAEALDCVLRIVAIGVRSTFTGNG
jgi:hypothetical protein